MKKSPTYRYSAILCSALLLTACGGGSSGGGGGSGGGTSSDPAPAPPVYVPDACTATSFNPYLPFSVNTSVDYLGNAKPIQGKVRCADLLTANKLTDIYRIDYDYPNQPLTLFISSTPDTIKLWEIDGPINVSGYSVNYIRFNPPLILRDGLTTGTDSGNITATVNSINTNGTFSYTRTETDDTYTKTSYFGHGDLPVKIAQLNGTFTISGQTANINTTFKFVEGLGIVYSYVNYAGYAVNIDDLTGLPEPIWFEYTTGLDPVLPASAPGNVFMINGTEISPADFEIVNSAELNALTWLSIGPNVSNTGFEVTTSYDASLDSLSYPYSVEVIFNNKATGEHMSGNITLNHN